MLFTRNAAWPEAFLGARPRHARYRFSFGQAADNSFPTMAIERTAAVASARLARPATNRNGASGKLAKSLRCALNSVFSPGILVKSNNDPSGKVHREDT